MALLLRRSCAMLVLLLTLTPLLAGAAEAGKARPVAWLALRSYQRLEQRLREISTMAKTPGLADMMLGMVQLQLAGLGGLDRQRPISVVVTTVSLAGSPPVTVVLPYTERDAMLQTLRNFFHEFACPAERYSAAFLEAADTYDLDWRLLPSLSFIETTGGKRARNNNLFGWDSGRAQFPTPTAGIHAVGYRLKHSRLYKNKVLDDLLAVYNHDADYGPKVKSVMRRISPAE